jgi:hypothetical protein
VAADATSLGGLEEMMPQTEIARITRDWSRSVYQARLGGNAEGSILKTATDIHR